MMKTISTLFALTFAFFSSTLQAQTAMAYQAEAFAPEGWEVSENWIDAYRQNVSAYGSLGWISEAMDEGTHLLTNEGSKGIILLQEIDNEDNLSMEDLAEEGYFHGHTALGATEETTSFAYSGAIATLRGELDDEPVLVRKICLPGSEPGKAIAILSIVPQKEALHQQHVPVFSAGNAVARSYSQYQVGAQMSSTN